jgi:branched-chain amino acid transport system substrate-binding protein
MVNGIKLALSEHGGKVGAFAIEYTSLDDSTAQAGSLTPEATAANARKAAQDESMVAYIGEWNSGASAVSIPILNEVPLAQISPGNTVVGLTADAPGAEPGEPDTYYPSGKRNCLRVVPKDSVQGAALATLMRQDGCKTLYVLNDKEVYGAGLAQNVLVSGKEQGIEILANDGIDPKAPNYRSHANKIAGAGPDCFLYSGITANNAVQLYRNVAQALPDTKRYGSDGVAESGSGGLPANVGSRVRVTIPTLLAGAVPARGQEVLRRVRQGVRRGQPEPGRDLRLRGDGPRARHDRAARRPGQRPRGRDRRAVRDRGPPERPRQPEHR